MLQGKGNKDFFRLVHAMSPNHIHFQKPEKKAAFMTSK